MWNSTLVDKFDNSPQAGAVRVRVGERPHLSTVAIVVWKPEYQNNSDTFEAVDAEDAEDAAEKTCLILEESGFGTEFPNARVDFLHAETGKLLPAWSRTEKIHELPTSPGQSVESVLAEALRQNNTEIRRMFGMVCETLAAREERIDDDRDRLIESSIEAVQSRAEAELTQILWEESNDAQVEVDPLKEQAGAILQGLAQQMFGNGASPRDTVMAILHGDPALTAQLANDPEVVGLFTQAMEQEEAPDVEPVGTPEPPSPMPE